MARKQLKNIPATMQRIDKKAKPTDVAPKVTEESEYKCSCCGHKYKRQRSFFYSSGSPIYHGNNGYTTICKKCILSLFDQYTKFYDNDEDAAMERICQITDMWLDDATWDASRKVSAEYPRISNYISKLNLVRNAGDTYSDTLIRRWEAAVAEEEEEAAREAAEEAAREAARKAEEKEDEPETSPVVVRRFGTGFTAGDYDSLEYEYQNWVEKYGPPVDKRQEELYISICYMKLNLQKSIQSGGSGTGTLANAYKSLIEAATTEIEDRKRRAESGIELTPIGVMIRDIEQYCPAEFYKNKKIYSNEDDMGSYIDRHFLRPIRNLITGSKELDREFNLNNMEE